MTLDHDEVLAAAREWVWLPPDAVDERTDEYRLVQYPSRWAVQWSRTDRLDELVAELRRRVASTDHGVLRWWVTEQSRPADTGDRLEALGGAHVEATAVLAWDLTEVDPFAGVDGLDVPADVEVVPVEDADLLDVAARLDATIFDWAPMTAVQRAAELAEIERALASGAWSTRRYVAVLDGGPVGTAGATAASPAVRLWGAGVLPAARGRGAYRALLDARLRWGAAQGERFALVKGRVDTSAPVLRRVGFTGLGVEHCWQWSAGPTG